MKIFSVENKQVFEGAIVSPFELSSGDKIPAIVVGESGRGRKRAIVPVSLSSSQEEEMTSKGSVKIFHATLGQTKKGGPKLISASSSAEEEEALIVDLSGIGFRGSNKRSGDCAPDWSEENPKFLPFPGRVIATGVIAQGDAGRMGSGEQVIFSIPKGVIWRLWRGGRLYGAPSSLYYTFTGRQILVATWDEREASDLF